MKRAAALALSILALAGCGSSSSSSGGARGSKPQLTVSAAASLKSAFTAYGASFKVAQTRFSFTGSDILAAQIQSGARPDVFASANLDLPRKLYAKGLLSRPQTFAANTLVLAVPAGTSKVHSLSDLTRPGVTVAIGSATVPIGAYTRKVLARLPASQEKQILAHVRTEEPDVSGIVGKLSQGAVDAGFTYVTDVRTTHGKLRAVPLPASLQPSVAYGIAVVKGTKNGPAASRFIAGLLSGPGQRDLRRAGFLPPPR